MGVDTGGQSGVSVCETEEGGEVATEDDKKVQEDGQSSVAFTRWSSSSRAWHSCHQAVRLADFANLLLDRDRGFLQRNRLAGPL